MCLFTPACTCRLLLGFKLRNPDMKTSPHPSVLLPPCAWFFAHKHSCHLQAGAVTHVLPGAVPVYLLSNTTHGGFDVFWRVTLCIAAVCCGVLRRVGSQSCPGQSHVCCVHLPLGFVVCQVAGLNFVANWTPNLLVSLGRQYFIFITIWRCWLRIQQPMNE